MPVVREASPTAERAKGSRGRTLSTWIVSGLAGLVFLWFASQRLRLVPGSLAITEPLLLLAAIGLHVPYACVRALRLAFVLDPLVAHASDGRRRGLDRNLLYGSGLVSFFVLLALPLKLGELSRPLLLERGRAPGLGLPEAISGVGLERIVDGLLICALLFVGLALGRPDPHGGLADVERAGAWMLAVFAIGLVLLVVAARHPVQALALVARAGSPFGARVQSRATALAGRFIEPMRGVLDLGRCVAFLAWSCVYWGITTLQLWLVLHATGLPLGGAEAAAIVAIVGLSIQLPGGPLQSGTFQVGTAVALGLFVPPETVSGPGSTFAAVMYLLQVGGAAVLALPGLALMAWAVRSPGA